MQVKKKQTMNNMYLLPSLYTPLISEYRGYPFLSDGSIIRCVQRSPANDKLKYKQFFLLTT